MGGFIPHFSNSAEICHSTARLYQNIHFYREGFCRGSAADLCMLTYGGLAYRSCSHVGQMLQSSSTEVKKPEADTHSTLITTEYSGTSSSLDHVKTVKRPGCAAQFRNPQCLLTFWMCRSGPAPSAACRPLLEAYSSTRTSLSLRKHLSLLMLITGLLR